MTWKGFGRGGSGLIEVLSRNLHGRTEGFSEYTEINSLKAINRLVFVKKMQCDFCEVRDEFRSIT
jgi:hypothetical protein